ncbi:MAG: ABC transporter ATP-binding protein [Desulfomonile tiedjei]|uniref:ABC transporter ATP-binding protein n=1 Tax=Desulfomonile tiedjei TaxID=2358 RepID=A0A9D6V343_9BACT|nr:ABC transporter ATP-binding protein [Desulfomonile tiedjei]
MADHPNSVLLDLKDVSRSFAGIRALSLVSFSVERGTILSLIGPNGAGKSTLINVITGVYAPHSGVIDFEGENIAGRTADVVASKGIARTFQLEELFGSMTVLENAMTGCNGKSRSGMFSCGFALPAARREEERIRQEAIESLALVGLEERAFEPISRLPLGERKLVGIARALCTKPTLLMLDEPAGGLAAHEAERLVSLIHLLLEKGLTILLVEHNMPFVMSLSDKIVVLEAGVKIAEGIPEAVRNNPRVIKAYLGQEQ